MAYCKKCGTELEKDANMCLNCGTPVGSSTENKGSENKSNEFKKEFYNNEQYTAEDIEKNRIYAILAYLGVLIIIPLVVAKDSPFARFHTNQGLVLLIALVICQATTIIPLIGVIGGIATVLIIVLLVLGIVNAAKGEAKKLPFIGEIKILDY